MDNIKTYISTLKRIEHIPFQVQLAKASGIFSQVSQSVCWLRQQQDSLTKGRVGHRVKPTGPSSFLSSGCAAQCTSILRVGRVDDFDAWQVMQPG